MRFSTWIASDNKKDKYFVGLAGYCSGKFDEEKAKNIISDMFDDIENMMRCETGFKKELVLVSGLTNIGILKLGYEEATRRKWSTMGIAPQKALDYECFPVTYKDICGREFGDESEHFVRTIDILIAIGDGKQTLKELEMTRERKIPAYHFELERTND